MFSRGVLLSSATWIEELERIMLLSENECSEVVPRMRWGLVEAGGIRILSLMLGLKKKTRDYEHEGQGQNLRSRGEYGVVGVESLS